MSSFLAVSLILALGWVHAFSQFREHFRDDSFYHKRIAQLEVNLEKQQFLNLINQYELEDFQTEVAELLPNVKKKIHPSKEKDYPLRNLASVVGRPSGDKLSVLRANDIFQKGKKKFNEDQYSQAIRDFKALIRHYSFSIHTAEAYLLLAESQFQLRQFDNCLKTVEAMLELFPESEVTGFALLRTGKIYEEQNRPEDAVEVYKTVLNAFKHPQLAAQAQLSLRTVEL